METVVLLLQIGLFLVFAIFGLKKMFLPIEKIEKKVSWAKDYPHNRIKLFGFLEFIGALGILLPYRLDVFPILTPIAATCLSMVMAGAAVVHLKRDELGMIFINIIIIFLLAGVGFRTLIDIWGVEL